MPVEVWKVFAALGIPGLSLGVLYGLYRFNPRIFSAIPRRWMPLISIIYMVLVFIVVMTGVLRFADGDRKSAQAQPGVVIKGDCNVTNTTARDITVECP